MVALICGAKSQTAQTNLVVQLSLNTTNNWVSVLCPKTVNMRQNYITKTVQYTVWFMVVYIQTAHIKKKQVERVEAMMSSQEKKV